MTARELACRMIGLAMNLLGLGLGVTASFAADTLACRLACSAVLAWWGLAHWPGGADDD